MLISHIRRTSRLLITLLILGPIPPSEAFQAFDCQHPTATTRVLDTSAPARCPNVSTEFRNSTVKFFQLARTATDVTARAIQCQVFQSRRVTACGFDSISYASVHSRWNKAIRISKQACIRALETGVVEVEGAHIPFTERVMTHHHGFTHGIARPDGSCEVEDFSTDGIIYRSSYEESYTTVYITRLSARIDQATGMALLPNGLKAPAADGHLFDVEQGMIIWHPPEQKECLEQLSEYYRGVGFVRTRRQRQGYEGAVMLVGGTDKAIQHLGLILGSKVTVCKKECYAVSTMDNFIVCFYDEETGAPAFPNLKFNPRDAATDPKLALAELKARSDFQHISGHLQVQARFKALVEANCRVEQKTLWNKIQSISGNSNPHALMDILGKGYLITPAGAAAAYITKCIPVEVTLADFANCTLEVPVHKTHVPDTPVNRPLVQPNINRTASAPPAGQPRDIQPPVSAGQGVYFMNPVTRILQRYPAVVSCSAVMPVRWKIAGDWYCSTPKPVRCEPPEQLKPETAFSHMEASFLKGMEHGNLLSPEMRESVYRFQEESAHRDAILLTAARNSLHNAKEGRLGSTLGTPDVHAFTRRVVQHISPAWLFAILGTYTTYMLGMLTLASVAWTIITALCRCVDSFATYGWDGGRTVGRALASMLGIITLPRRLLLAILDSYKQDRRNDNNRRPGQGGGPSSYTRAPMLDKDAYHTPQQGYPKLADIKPMPAFDRLRLSRSTFNFNNPNNTAAASAPPPSPNTARIPPPPLDNTTNSSVTTTAPSAP